MLNNVESFYFIKLKHIWAYFKNEKFSFWMICCYLFFEYARPQAIIPALDFMPWAQTFILLSFVGALLDKTVKWTSSPANILIIFLAVAILLSSIVGEYPEISYDHFVDFYSWFVIYFLIINIVNTRERFYILLLIFILCSAKIAIGTSKAWALRGFGFTSWGLMGPQGYFQNSGELAILMLTLFPVTVKIFLCRKRYASKIEYIALTLFSITPILTILGASSRGAQIALVIVLILMFRRNVFRVKPLMASLAIIIALFFLMPEEQKKRFTEVGEDKTSQQRILYWKNGLEMIKDNPLLGIGFFNFPKYYSVYYAQDMLYKHAELPHNIFIQVGVDAGMLGLVPFILIILLCFNNRSIKNYEECDPVLVSAIKGVSYGILGFVIAGQFVTVAYYPFLWIGLAFIVSGRRVVTENVKNRKNA